jgi:hypothetical protein
MNIRPGEDEMFHAVGQTWRRSEMLFVILRMHLMREKKY